MPKYLRKKSGKIFQKNFHSFTKKN